MREAEASTRASGLRPFGFQESMEQVMPRDYSEEARQLHAERTWSGGHGLCVYEVGVTLRARGLRMACVQLEVLPGPSQSLS